MDTILAYLRQLEANNNKPWFDAHKKEYQDARTHFNAIVESLIEGDTIPFPGNKIMPIWSLMKS